MKRLFEAFHKAGRELFLVGGAVRDLAMGHEYRDLDDLDFATNAMPEESLDILQRAGFRTYDVGIEFGTAGAILKGPRGQGYPKDVQVTTYRSNETYRRGSRHPIVRFGSSIEEDLWRRDFSINSIAMDAEGRYVDPYDGRGDIERQTLRAVGDPVERLAEDPLRILRIARFMSKLGFDPDEALRNAAHQKSTHLLDIARQRWLQEMGKLLKGPHVRKALPFLVDVRAMNVILPELVALVDLHRRCPGEASHQDFWALTVERVHLAAREDVARWVALFADIGRPWTRNLSPVELSLDGAELAGLSVDAFPQSGAPTGVSFHNHEIQAALLSKGIARRFQFDNARTDAISFLLEHQRDALAYEASWSDADIRRFVQTMQGKCAEGIALGRLFQAQDGERAGEANLGELESRISGLEAAGQLLPVIPNGMGGALMQALGMRPGPILGELIAWIKEEIICGEIPSGLDADAYIAHLKERQPPIMSRV